jgi:ribosome-binding factor A
MKPSRSKEIKQSQKASLILKEFSQLFLTLVLDEPRLQGLSVTRAKLSADGGFATLFFIAPGGKQEFEEKLKILILYKPSLRSALSKILLARYTPDLIFKYDEEFEKTRRIDELIDKLKGEGKL